MARLFGIDAGFSPRACGGCHTCVSSPLSVGGGGELAVGSLFLRTLCTTTVSWGPKCARPQAGSLGGSGEVEEQTGRHKKFQRGGFPR